MFTVRGKYCEAKIHTDLIEDSALRQVYAVCNSPVSEGSVIHLMPDVHAGAGVPIGFTQRLDPENLRVAPNLVSVDIGCRVSMVRLNDIGELDLAALDKFIRGNIPLGTGSYDQGSKLGGSLLDRVPHHYLEKVSAAEEMVTEDGARPFKTAAVNQLFSLGSGNHYIEVDQSEDGELWLNVHSGSRNLGLTVATTYQNKAVEHSGGRGPQDLCYLDRDSVYFDRYLACVEACQLFSQINHQMILQAIWSHVFGDGGDGFRWEDAITTLHNYIDLDNMIIRKGAISARKGERVLIPFNMRDGVGIFIGKGNEDWNWSAPHGCGRLMSRSQAKRQIDIETVREEMRQAGIYTTSLEYALDEAADAYKDRDFILSQVAETVEQVELLKPVYNIKGK